MAIKLQHTIMNKQHMKAYNNPQSLKLNTIKSINNIIRNGKTSICTKWISLKFILFLVFMQCTYKNVQMQTPLFACMMQPFYATPFKKNMTQWNIVNWKTRHLITTTMISLKICNITHSVRVKNCVTLIHILQLIGYFLQLNCTEWA